MLKAVIFDLDGTIGNTLPICIRAFEEAVSPYAGRRLTRREVVETFGLNEEGMVRAIVTDRWREALHDFYRVYESMLDGAQLYEGIPELLDLLRQAGVRLALVTGKGAECCQVTLRHFGLEDFFSDVLTGDPGENVKAKNIRAVMERYGLKPEECFYVGDALSDIEQSQKAGLVCLSAAWDPSADLRGTEEKNPGGVFRRVSQLRGFLLERLSSAH